MSNRAVEGLMQRLVCRRRRGRIKTPALDARRLARLRLLFAKVDITKRAEDAGLPVIVDIDKSFLRKAHGSLYSYFLRTRTELYRMVSVAQRARAYV